MMVDPSATTLDGLLESFSRCIDADSSRRLAAFNISAEAQARVDELAEKANEGALTETERGEYEAFISAADFISILKLKVLRRLTATG
jgi:hypothetical protein